MIDTNSISFAPASAANVCAEIIFVVEAGPEAAVRDLLTQFGVIAELKGDLLQHTLTTLLIGEDGKIVHRADGSAWEPKEFVARMRR